MVKERKEIKITFLLIPFLFHSSFTQVHQDLMFITTHHPIILTQNHQPTSFTFRETQEIKLGLTLAIRAYQLFISSQQSKNICVFTPSCSRFGMAAIQKYSAFYGILMASDRLQRCHGWGHKDLPIRLDTFKYDDPLENYQLGKKPQ